MWCAFSSRKESRLRTPEVWSLDRVRALDPAETIVWVTPSVRERVAATLPFRIATPDETAKNLVVVGGGTLLDEAKLLAAERGVTLIAIPSIWGSGAEASPVVVLQRGAVKDIRMDEVYVPHARVVWPELASEISEQRAREACGDAWAHALEGFLSPLANEPLRDEGIALMREMLAIGIGRDPRWFDLSARACALQARSSVGLIHGIAHVLEGPLRARYGDAWGHARLCATFFKPVLALDRRSEKVETLVQTIDLQPAADALFDEASYREALELLPEHWATILRDRCTRTNALLVRAGDLAHFERFAT